jgi:hypothetical protein
MHEINANGVGPNQWVRLDARTPGSIGVVRFDGGPGFRLFVTNDGPDVASYAPVDVAAGMAASNIRPIQVGETVTIEARTEMWTPGSSSLRVDKPTVVNEYGRRVVV